MPDCPSLVDQRLPIACESDSQLSYNREYVQVKVLHRGLKVKPCYTCCQAIEREATGSHFGCGMRILPPPTVMMSLQRARWNGVKEPLP
jgi:hypothetical protein